MSEFNSKELKIIDAAQLLFYRHGFKRVTMHDIAVGADMSRPALYLIFPNKEIIFEAVVRHRGGRTLQEIRSNLPTRKATAEKLQLAFELWTVRPFEGMQQSPDARDLIECTHGFARAALDEITKEFTAIVQEILTLITPARDRRFNAGALAHLLVASTHGFKSAAANSDELRNLIARQITIVLTALESVKSRPAKRPESAL